MCAYYDVHYNYQGVFYLGGGGGGGGNMGLCGVGAVIRESIDLSEYPCEYATAYGVDVVTSTLVSLPTSTLKGQQAIHNATHFSLGGKYGPLGGGGGYTLISPPPR